MFFSKEITAQSETNACITLSKIDALVKEFHYRPKPINDSLSAYLFTTFLQTLDDRNDLFLESEINVLKKHKYKLDNYINSQDCNFLNEFYTTYKNAVNRHSTIIETIKKEYFTLDSPEIIRFYKKSTPYFKNESELKRVNKKRMLFDVLKDVSEISHNKDSLVNVFNSISQTSKQKVFDDYSCESTKYNLSIEEFNTRFFTVFCAYFDPHTEYFSTNEKSDFLSYVSADNYTFGLTLSVKEKNNISVVEILPGSSAYFSEKVELGDQFIKIKSKEEEYLVNCYNFEKIEKTLSSNEHKNGSFTLRKKSGEVYTVNLTKQIMKDYQNSVYSYILERDNHKTGYIKIPSFYSTLENGKTNVSDDVSKEIFKLKEDAISGLIIDLENNGGGSMQEAINMCGLFINTLYLGQDRNKTNKEGIIGNRKSKSIYTGPIIILINGFSASASEFFANAMQDYNLAVVVGTKSLGKATYQEILPLKDEKDKFVKVTLGKFYRVTGKSNQYNGIKPDIEIPNIFDDQMPRENSFKTAFKNDTVESIVNTDNFPMNEKQKKAILHYTKKTETNTEFQKIIRLKAKFNQIYTSSLPPITLKFNTLFDKLSEFTKSWKEIEEFTKTEYSFGATNTTYDTQKSSINNYLESINKKQIKNLKTNFRIFEAIRIMEDLK